MKRIIYSSEKSSHFSSFQIYVMLENAKKKNRLMGISGMILYANNQFLQVFEGMDAPVMKLKEKIISDDRHYNIKIAFEDEVSDLEYSFWDMEYCDEDTLREIIGTKVFNPKEMTLSQMDELLNKFKQFSS